MNVSDGEFSIKSSQQDDENVLYGVASTLIKLIWKWKRLHGQKAKAKLKPQK